MLFKFVNTQPEAEEFLDHFPGNLFKKYIFQNFEADRPHSDVSKCLLLLLHPFPASIARVVVVVLEPRPI